MDELIKAYTADIDLLLTEVCMTAAMHGLDQAVTGIAEHLRELPRTEGAALLAQSLSKTAVRDFPQAIALAEQVLGNPQLSVLHGEAAAFRRLAEQLASGQPPQPLVAAG
jgi:hypothetical protein